MHPGHDLVGSAVVGRVSGRTGRKAHDKEIPRKPIFERKKKREEKREKRKKRKLQDVRKQRRKGLRQDKEMSRSPEGEGRRINSKRQKHRGTKKFSLR